MLQNEGDSRCPSCNLINIPWGKYIMSLWSLTAAAVKLLILILPKSWFLVCVPLLALENVCPSLGHRLQSNDDIVSAWVPVQLLDVINIVDIESNVELGPRPPNSAFSLSGNGYKGIYLVFMPDMSSLQASIWYRCFIVQDALTKLHSLGISTNLQPEQRERLTDEEIELFL